MPRKQAKNTLRVPALTLHKATGQARVRLQGRDHYVGAYGTDEAQERYKQLVAEWLSGQMPPQDSSVAHTQITTINRLIYHYLQFAKGYYVKRGSLTTGYQSMRDAARSLREHYGRSPANEFGPLKLKAIRESLIASGLSRSTINNRINRIRLIFKWGVENEMVDACVLQALQAVAGLRKGRSAAKELPPIRPVAAGVVNAVLPHLGLIVRDMVRLQLLTGCRPGEIISLRPCDVNRDGEAWEFIPQTHKTEHHGQQRRIYFGPKAQAILAPYLDNRPAESPCFSPQEAELQRRALQRQNRKTPVQPSQQRRARDAGPPRAGVAYSEPSYRRAIARACEQAFEMPQELRNVYNWVRETSLLRSGDQRNPGSGRQFYQAFPHGAHDMSGDLLFRTPQVQVVRQRESEWPYIAESLDEFDLRKFACPENLSLVMCELQSRGGTAPGVDDVHFQDLSPPEWMNVLRSTEELLLTGDYRPNPLRPYRIDKPTGGHRDLEIPTVLDRTIGSALQVALRKAWNRCYPGFTMSRYQTYVAFERGLQESGRRVLVTADITKCFPSVLIGEVLDAHESVIGNPWLLRVITQVVLGYEGTARQQGLAQGCPYSPAAMEVTLRSVLDEKWRTVAYQWHYADNFTFLCDGPYQGRELIEEFGAAIRNMGVRLRETGCAHVARERSHQVPVLGLCPTWNDGKCTWSIPSSTWRRLGNELDECQSYAEPHRAAHHLVHGFIAAIGPAVCRKDLGRHCSTLRKMLRGRGFLQLGATSLEDAMLAARTKWLAYKDRANSADPTPNTEVGPMKEDSLGDSAPPFDPDPRH